jgi:hypothetical protein
LDDGVAVLAIDRGSPKNILAGCVKAIEETT